MNNRNTATSSPDSADYRFRGTRCCGPRALSEESGKFTAVLKDGVAAFLCGVVARSCLYQLVGGGDIRGFGWRLEAFLLLLGLSW